LLEPAYKVIESAIAALEQYKAQ